MAHPLTISEMTDEQFERSTVDLIEREFGPEGLVRFIRQYRSGRGDYTAQRAEAGIETPLDSIWSDLEARGLTQTSPRS